MPAKRLLIILASLLSVLFIYGPASAYVAYDSRVVFFRTVTGDVLKLLPRAMGSYIYQNRYDFLRGMTYMERNIRTNTEKSKDLEEIKREAFERLHRDIPYCIEAFKGGEIKLDTSHTNLSGRLGMIAQSIILTKMPRFPSLEYLEAFARILESLIGENIIDVWVYYDGYGDFHSLGELLERLKDEGMPEFWHVQNKEYPLRMREDSYAMFRAPAKMKINMVVSDTEVNEMYGSIINCILDTYVYIWKCSGMDLSHPSYSAPPGTIVTRLKKRKKMDEELAARQARAAEAADKALDEITAEAEEEPEAEAAGGTSDSGGEAGGSSSSGGGSGPEPGAKAEEE
ncbi:MAG: hypothetical protein V2B18_16805 [Pseudomonadota bacterium]